MKTQKMPSRHLCLATSFAMALDMDVASLLAMLPDPYELVFPDLPEPHCFRGHHIQDLVRVVRNYGYSCTPHEMYPVTTTTLSEQHQHIIDNHEHFNDVILMRRGVITGVSFGPTGRVGHAVAFDHSEIRDPNGKEYLFSLENCRPFYPQVAWSLERAL